MKNFEDVLQQYEPMISASIRKLNIYRDHNQYKQAGRIALWQAWQRFDVAKGNFTPFAFRSIRGAMLDELKKENRVDNNTLPAEEELLASISDIAALIEPEWSDSLADALCTLSLAEQQLIHWLFVEGLTLADCAVRVGISVDGIKKRRGRALVKLRGILQ